MTATAINPKNKVERFVDYLQTNLSKQAYENLSKTFGYNTTNRVSRLLNPSADLLGQFNAKEVAILAEMLEVFPQDLIMDWGLGVQAITLDEANALVKDDGLELGFQIAA